LAAGLFFPRTTTDFLETLFRMDKGAVFFTETGAGLTLITMKSLFCGDAICRDF
jgi:hypothetical protein